MVPMTSLWLSIILAPILVFVAAALLWAVLNFHKHDWKKLPDEDAVMEALRASATPHGSYFFPSHLGVDERSPEYKERAKVGPTGIVTTFDPYNMGPRMAISFLYYLVVTFFVAYLASRTLGPGEEYLHVFRVVATAAFMAYGFGHAQNSIWFGKPWTATARDLVDAFIYALLTAGAFAGFWPGA
jgi:phosphate/sulfate permease